MNKQPSPEAIKVSYWLRFEHGIPASAEDIKKGTGIDLSKRPDILREGYVLGIFLWSNIHKGFI